jgi:hypothetical protein
MTAEVADSTAPEPYRSMQRPTNGEMAMPHKPPRLSAPENTPRDHPKWPVIGTTNTDNVFTDIRGLEVKLLRDERLRMNQP